VLFNTGSAKETAMNLRRSTLTLFALAICGLSSLDAASIDKITVFATGTVAGATNPDSITLDGSHVWIAYKNSADTTGLLGGSTVVEYDSTGNALYTYSIHGSVDGLKYDAERNLIWALQNEDGNSTLSLIDPTAHALTQNSPINYAVPSATRGWDDVVFLNGQVFMTNTNPAAASDPTIQIISSQNFLQAFTLDATPVLTMGATGLDLATGITQVTDQSDPDSLKETPWGGLMLTSEDGSLTFVENPGKSNQAVSFLPLIDPTTGMQVGTMDDAVFVTTPSGSFFVADQGNNRVLKVDVSDMQTPSLFANIVSLNELANVDLKTGVITPFLTNLKAPHGLVFVPRFSSVFGR